MWNQRFARRTVGVMAPAILFALLACAVAAQSLPTTVVARTGQDVPGVPGATFTTLGVLPRLGANGHVAFNGFIAGGGVPATDDFGYWVGQPGSLQVAIREDSNDSGPELFSGTTSVGVDASGGVSLWTQLAFPVPSNQNQVLWGNLPGNTVVAREGVTAAPGYTAGAVFAAIGSGPAFNDAGAAAFVGSATGGDATSGSDFGLFAGTPGNLQLVAREGSPAPGATGTAPVFSTSISPIFDKRINASGQVSFGAALSGAGVSALNDRAIYVWTSSGGGLALAAQSGSVAPGTSATITFTSTGFDDEPGFNDAGQVAFRAQLTSDVPGELNLVNNSGIWAGAPGGVQLIARSGTSSPIAGLQFRTPDLVSPRINAAGQVAFFTLVAGAGVTTANDRVFWVTTPGGIEPVAREGSAAPGTGAGVNFGTLDPIAVINAPGQVAFTATLTGTGVTTANDRGLWAGLPGDLMLVAREGEVIDLDPSAGELLKTVQTISFANGFSSPVGDSASAAFNDAGEIAWRAQFTDATTAVFLTAVPLPEPEETADFDEDGDVDGDDFLAWQRGLGTLVGATRADGNANVAEDGDVDGDDLAVWTEQFGTAGSAPVLAAVPEPAAMTGMLIATSALGYCGFRARRLNSAGA